MAIIHRYSELALFLMLNIFLAVPELLFQIKPEGSNIFVVLTIFQFITFAYIAYFKFTVFDFLYRRKKLPYIRKFLSKLQTDDKSLFFVTAAAIALDVVLNTRFTEVHTFQWLKPTDCPIFDTSVNLSVSGLSFSYIGFWCIKLFKKFKNRFWLKNHLSGFSRLVLYKLFSPLIFSFFLVIIETIIMYFYSFLDLLEIMLPIFIPTVVILSVIDAIIFGISGEIKKSDVLTITRIFREIEIFIALFGCTLFLIIAGFSVCPAN